MRKVNLFILCCLMLHFANAQTRYWINAAGGAWSNTANWSATSGGAGGASYPTTGNDVVFDGGYNIMVDMDVLSSTAFHINSLLITGSSVVNLNRTQPAGGVRDFILHSTSAVTKGLQINAGSTLIIEGLSNSGTLNYNFSLTGAAGVTGEISGNLFFSNPGSLPAGTALELQTGVSNYANLVVKNGGVIKYGVITGNTSPGSGSYLTMENGATYVIEKNGGTFPPGTWQPNSIAQVNNLVGNTAPTFNGSSYGNLVWNIPSQSSTLTNYFTKDISFNNVNLINTNYSNSNGELKIAAGGSALIYTMTVNGNLTIGADARLKLTSSTVTLGNGGRLVVKGNINNFGALLTDGNPGTINDLELNGTSLQQIDNSGTFGTGQFVFINNNSANTELLSNIAISYQLQLANGKIITGLTNTLTMIDGSFYTGGSSASFVQGKMAKEGATDFIFPIGIGGIYAPIGFANVAGAHFADRFEAEYKRTNPQSIHGGAVQPGMDHISYVEYWKLNQTVGAGTKKISLAVTPTSFSKDLAKTYVSRWNSVSSYWTSEGSTNGGATGSPYETGIITSVNNISSAGVNDFTLVTDLSDANNPLPVQLISFNAQKINSIAATITWSLAECCSRDARFEVEKSTDNRLFTSIAHIAGSEVLVNYDVRDNQLAIGVTYYRLKIIDVGDKVTYSAIKAVVNNSDKFLVTSFYPNPVRDQAQYNIQSSVPVKVVATIFNMSGVVMKQSQLQLIAGDNVNTLNVAALPAGIYQLVIIGEGKKLVTPFVKQ